MRKTLLFAALLVAGACAPKAEEAAPAADSAAMAAPAPAAPADSMAKPDSMARDTTKM